MLLKIRRASLAKCPIVHATLAL